MRHDDAYRSWRIVAATVLLCIAAVIAARSWVTLDQSVGGRFGYTPDPEGARAFLAELGDERFFSQAAPEAMQKAAGRDTFLYRAMQRAHLARYGKPFVVGKQLNGSCVAWGAMHAVWIAEAIDWELGKASEPPLAPSTEAIYGGSRCEARGKTFAGWSDGSTGFAAAKWLREWGVVYRKPYPSVDLTTYDAKLEKDWGAYGCGGQADGGKMDAAAKRHPCRHVVAVRNWAELTAAIESGFPVTLASSQGFSSTLGPSGIAEAQGTWMHQMVAVGVRYKANGAPDDLIAILNSWGPNWIGPQTNRYPDDLPAGAFWARRRVVEGMLGDAWAIGSVETGFKWRDIHHGDWLAPAVDTLTRLPIRNPFLDFQLGL